MKIKIPKRPGGEVFAWRKISELLAAGNRLSIRSGSFGTILRPGRNQEAEEKGATGGTKIIGYLLVGPGRRMRTSYH